MRPVQHRIFLVPPDSGLDPHVARTHWERRHPAVFARTPGLLGYRQHRAVAEQWRRGTALVCSETWFADRETERAAYRSDHYRNVVAEDEGRFLDRASAWSAVVLAGGEHLGATAQNWQVLWFDADPPAGAAAWNAVALGREVPGPGSGRTLHVAHVDDLGTALELVSGANVAALACRPVACAVAGEQ